MGCLLQFIECLALLLANAIIPFMVEDFFPEMPPSHVGFWSGSLLSIMYVGQLLSVPLWGWLADHWGRRPVLLLGLVGLIVCVTAFGLSPTYRWALVARFMWGVGCGNTAVIKAYVTEITDATNVGFGMGLLGMQWSLGQTLGPVLGGALARPARKYVGWFPELDAPFFHRYPYVLACAVPVILGTVTLIPALLYLPETRMEIPVMDECDNVHDGASVPTSAHTPPRISRTTSSDVSFASVALSFATDPMPRIAGKRLSNYVCVEQERGPDAEELLVRVPPSNFDTQSVWDVLGNYHIVIAIFIYAMTETIYDVLDGLLPIWMVTPSAEGGFDFHSTTVGAILAVGGPVQLVWQPLVFPLIVAKYGYRKIFIISMVVFGLGLLAAPFASLYPHRYWLRVVLVGLLNVVPGTAAITATCCSAVIINNIAPSHLRGRVNGIGETLAAALRVVSPVIFSGAFAWVTSSHSSWPLTYHSVFHVCALWAFLEVYLCLFLPAAVEHRPTGPMYH